MRSSAISIGWEVWRRNRWASVLVLGTIPGCYLLHSIQSFGAIRETLTVFELLAMLFAIASIFWMHSYVEVDKQGRHAGFPSRMFVLPLPTATLATFPMLFGVVTIVLFYFLWSCWIFPTWNVHLSASWLGCHLLSLAAMMVSLQAIIWSFHRFPWIRFVLVSAVLIGIGAFGIVMPVFDFPALGQAGTILCLLAILAIGYLGAIAGVERDRHGGWEGWTGRVLRKLLDRLPHRRKDFHSAARAQLWFEWRRKGFFLAGLLALPSAATLTVFPVPSALYFETGQAWLTYSALPVMVAIAAATVGLGLAKSDFWRRDLALNSFIAIRPMTTGDLVMAKMKAGALIVLWAIPLFLIVAIPAFQIPQWVSGEDAAFPSWSRFKAENVPLLSLAGHPLIILTSLALIWKGMIGGMCVGLTGTLRSILLRSWLRATFFFGLIWVAIHFLKNPALLSKWLPLLPWLGAGLVLLKLAATFQAMRVVTARRLHSKTQLSLLVTIWMTLAGCLIASAFFVGSSNLLPGEIIFLGVAYLFPDSSFARCAIHLDSNRHR